MNSHVLVTPGTHNSSGLVGSVLGTEMGSSRGSFCIEVLKAFLQGLKVEKSLQNGQK